MVRVFTIAFIEGNDANGRAVHLSAPGGDIATPVFETIEAAEAYRHGLPMSEEWRVRGLQQNNAVLWLKSLDKKGIRFVVPQPTIGEPLLEEEFLSITAFLSNFYYR